MQRAPLKYTLPLHVAFSMLVPHVTPQLVVLKVALQKVNVGYITIAHRRRRPSEWGRTPKQEEQYLYVRIHIVFWRTQDFMTEPTRVTLNFQLSGQQVGYSCAKPLRVFVSLPGS